MIGFDDLNLKTSLILAIFIFMGNLNFKACNKFYNHRALYNNS